MTSLLLYLFCLLNKKKHYTTSLLRESIKQLEKNIPLKEKELKETIHKLQQLIPEQQQVEEELA